MALCEPKVHVLASLSGLMEDSTCCMLLEVELVKKPSQAIQYCLRKIAFKSRHISLPLLHKPRPHTVKVKLGTAKEFTNRFYPPCTELHG